MVLTGLLRALIWIGQKLIPICFIPLNIIRLFQKRKVVPPIKNDILFLPASILAEKIRSRELTSEKVVQSYIQRISEVNGILNAVIQERFQDALEEAKRVEGILNSDLTVKEIAERYPLLGVPITIKGSVAVEGLNHSAGVLLRNKIALKDADAVKKVREAGAIPLLVSNTPEFCLNWETTNKLIGTTNNPYDIRKTVGGSSGGEGALIGAAASILGIGSDIAGSLRIPMHFCGVWGHKPSPRLISIEGHYPSCPEEEWHDVFHIGPISRYASDLSLLFEILVEDSSKNKLKHPINLKKLKVYYVKEIKNCLVVPVDADTKQAVEKVVSHLNAYTETSICRELDNELFEYASEYSYLRLLLVDNVDNLFQGKGEGSHLEMLKFIFCLSKSVFTSIGYGLLRWWLWAVPETYKIQIFDDIASMKRKVLEILDDQSVLIMPVFIRDAPPHGDVFKTLFSYGYCSIINSLGLPSTACPVMQSERGMPIGVQVIGAPNCDRLCLSVAKEIESAFGGWKPPSSNYVRSESLQVINS